MATEPSPSHSGDTRERSARRHALLWLLGVLVLLAALRVWKIDLDPPNLIVRGYTCEAHFRDEAAKAHEARNKANWDRWSLSEHDEYEFWRAQSPAWVWGERAWFELFGVGVIEARWFVVVHTITALALLMWLVWVRHGFPAALTAGLLLGLNWGYLIYSRLALMEGALLCWLLVVTLALSQLERRPQQFGRWTAIAVAAMFVACTIKQSGLLVVPAFVLALLLLGLRDSGLFAREARSRDWSTRLRASVVQRPATLALLGVSVLGGALALLLLNPDYQQRLAFNAEHFTGARENPVLGSAASTFVRGWFSIRLQLIFTRLAPLTMWLATLELARMVFVAIRRRRADKRGQVLADSGALLGRPDLIDLWMLTWAVLGLLANLASPHRAIRFVLILLPPAAWLAGVFVGRLWNHAFQDPRVGRVARILAIAVGLLGVSVTAIRFVDWTRENQRTASEIGEQLEGLIGDRHAVVVGEFAAQAVFETRYWHFYVRPNQFNTSDEILDALGITHLVVGEDDFVEEYLTEHRPDMLRGRRELGQVEFRGQTLTVWELALAD